MATTAFSLGALHAVLRDNRYVFIVLPFYWKLTKARRRPTLLGNTCRENILFGEEMVNSWPTETLKPTSQRVHLRLFLTSLRLRRELHQKWCGICARMQRTPIGASDSQVFIRGFSGEKD